jgi:Na+-translocating ferredoxin:NAD+ oxidoreductase RnfG subunit
MITRLTSERGTSLIETAIATGILLVVMAGLLSMAALATTYTENHGHLEARTTEYAQDKMEQLLALAYSDRVSDTVVFPAASGGGTGMKIGGGLNTAAPVIGYVDWLAQDGSLLGGGTTPPATWFYERIWQLTCAVAPCSDVSPISGVKEITITSTVRSSVGHALIPRSTVVALKASQF